MATRAHSTRAPLLRLSGEGARLSLQPSHRSPQPLLGLGLGRQPGPVTLAIRAMRAAEPDFGTDADLRSSRLLSRALAVFSVKGGRA